MNNALFKLQKKDSFSYVFALLRFLFKEVNPGYIMKQLFNNSLKPTVTISLYINI